MKPVISKRIIYFQHSKCAHLFKSQCYERASKFVLLFAQIKKEKTGLQL